MGQSSLGGGSLKSASSRSSAARSLQNFLMLRPMLVLAFGVAILDEFTRLASLETGAPLLAALGAAAICHHSNRQLYKLSIFHSLAFTNSTNAIV
jgi:hypothetical protein